jgi:hypothetical protein
MRSRGGSRPALEGGALLDRPGIGGALLPRGGSVVRGATLSTVGKMSLCLTLSGPPGGAGGPCPAVGGPPTSLEACAIRVSADDDFTLLPPGVIFSDVRI